MSTERTKAISDIQTQIEWENLRTDLLRADPATQVLPPDIATVVNPYDTTTQTEAAPPPPESSLQAGIREQQQRARQAAAQTKEYFRNVNAVLRAQAKQANRSIGSFPTPGGIWVPFWILLFIFLILIPVNQHTRMSWFWMVITGNADLTGSPVVGNVPGDTGSGATNSSPGLSLVFDTSTSTSSPTVTGNNPTGIVPVAGPGYLFNNNNLITEGM